MPIHDSYFIRTIQSKYFDFLGAQLAQFSFYHSSTAIVGEHLPLLPPKFVSDNYSVHFQKYQKCPLIQSQTVYNGTPVSRRVEHELVTYGVWPLSDNQAPQESFIRVPIKILPDYSIFARWFAIQIMYLQCIFLLTVYQLYYFQKTLVRILTIVFVLYMHSMASHSFIVFGRIDSAFFIK